jgi:hypothetical protein
MIKYVILNILCLISYGMQAQSISSSVIASCGQVGQLNHTIGQLAYLTLNNNVTLTQGFQQTYTIQLNLKAFLQGYYVGASTMADVLYQEGVTSTPGLYTDTLRVELRQSVPPYNLVWSTQERMLQNGQLILHCEDSPGQSCYIVLKHRNHVETWSAQPIVLGVTTTYDFSTNASQAFRDNQEEMEPGVYAMFTGDINQDDAVDALDFIEMDADIIAGNYGYLRTDLNGDGSVDALDYLLLEPNITLGITVLAP